MTIHLAGDSTVAECPPEEFPMSGWGAALGEFVDEPVVNLAKGGATTESFIAEGLWHQLVARVRTDDTVIVQFGHNDQKEPALDADGGYRDRLTGFVADIRDRGASPILATSPERRRFADGVVLSTHGPYPRAVRDLGASLGVAVIDLAAFTRWLYGWLGEQRSVELFTHLDPGQSAHWPDGLKDDTHFNVTGARTLAAFVAESLRAIRGVDALEPALGKWGVFP